MPRSKGAAAALDFFVWGSGHGFLGYRKALGFPWIIWTLILVLFTIIDAYVAKETTAFYYIDYSNGFGQLAYNTGASIAVAFVPYLIVGGLMIFDLIRTGGLPSVGPIHASPQLAAAQQQPAPQPAPMMVQQAGKFCPSCGAAVTPADTFCPSCGAGLRPAAPATAPQPVSGARVCNSCGTTNPSGYNFCKRCGSKLT